MVAAVTAVAAVAAMVAAVTNMSFVAGCNAAAAVSLGADLTLSRTMPCMINAHAC